MDNEDIATLIAASVALTGLGRWLILSRPELTLVESSSVKLELKNIGKSAAHEVAPRSLDLRLKPHGAKHLITGPKSLESWDNKISRLAANETLKIPIIPGIKPDQTRNIEHAKFTLEVTYRPIKWICRKKTKSWLVEISNRDEIIDIDIRVGRHKIPSKSFWRRIWS